MSRAWNEIYQIASRQKNTPLTQMSWQFCSQEVIFLRNVPNGYISFKVFLKTLHVMLAGWQFKVWEKQNKNRARKRLFESFPARVAELLRNESNNALPAAFGHEALPRSQKVAMLFFISWFLGVFDSNTSALMKITCLSVHTLHRPPD